MITRRDALLFGAVLAGSCRFLSALRKAIRTAGQDDRAVRARRRRCHGAHHRGSAEHARSGSHSWSRTARAAPADRSARRWSRAPSPTATRFCSARPDPPPSARPSTATPATIRRKLRPGRARVESPIVLVINPAVPAKTVAELVAYAKAHPASVHFASPGYGTQPHLVGEMFKATTGAPMVHVPYRGSAPAITDLMAGQMQMLFRQRARMCCQHIGEPASCGRSQLTGEARDPQLPEIRRPWPRAASAASSATYWNGVLAPAGNAGDASSPGSTPLINDGLHIAEIQASLAQARRRAEDRIAAGVRRFHAAERRSEAAREGSVRRLTQGDSRPTVAPDGNRVDSTGLVRRFRVKRQTNTSTLSKAG